MVVQQQEAVRPVVEEVVGKHGDSTVLEYIISVLEDGDFEYGPSGQEAYDAFGEMLVGTCNINRRFAI